MNPKEIKQSHNIVDYINQYVPLKKTGNGEYSALCPFHSEKTPSMTVNEPKQFYYCFGCGAAGDLIKFVEEYQGVDFIDACKILGGEVDDMDLKTVAANQARPIITYPKFDKRDPESARAFCEKATRSDRQTMPSMVYKNNEYLPVTDLDDGSTVNIYSIATGGFLAGGVSHRAATVIQNDLHSNKFIICTDYESAVNFVGRYENIMIAYSPYNMRMIVENFKDYEFIPAITLDDTHAHSLTETHDYIFINEDGRFKGMNKGEDFE